MDKQLASAKALLADLSDQLESAAVREHNKGSKQNRAYYLNLQRAKEHTDSAWRNIEHARAVITE